MPNCPEGYRSGFGIPKSMARSVCMTRSYFGHDEYGLGVYTSGSGFLMNMQSRKAGVLTAAHNLYHPRLGRKAKRVNFYFGRNGQDALAKRTLVGENIPREFERVGKNRINWDFAIAWIKPLGRDRFRPIDIAQSTATHSTKKLMVGYPDEDRCKGTYKVKHAKFDVLPLGKNTYTYFDQPSYRGLSGAPLLAPPTKGARLAAYGLHTLGGSEFEPRAIRFSPEVIRRLRGWVANA